MATTSITTSITATEPVASSPRRWPLLVVALALLVPAWFCGQLASSRYTCQKALELAEQGDWRAARQLLQQAEARLPGHSSRLPDSTPYSPFIATGDLPRQAVALAESYLAEVAVIDTAPQAYQTLRQAEQLFRLARGWNPDEVIAQTGLAQTVAALERAYPYLAPGTANPHQARPEFERLLQLRPNGIEAHFLFIRYLQHQDDSERLLQLISHLASIYPASAQHLLAAGEYRVDILPALEKGLRLAADNAHYAAGAYQALAQLLEKQGDLAQATVELEKALALQAEKNSWYQYHQLAGLYLRQEQKDTAQRYYLQALAKATDTAAVLRSIWADYKNSKQYQPFLDLLRQANQNMRLPDVQKILHAYCLLEMGETELAKSNFLLVKDPDYQAEALRGLATQAGKDKDWDAMELASQRATVVEPWNSANYHLFNQALRQQKKFPQAEAALDTAIAAVKKPDPWLFSARGWNRWDRQNWSGARADWQEAVHLLPNNGHLHYYLALGYEQEGDRQQAIAALRQAVRLVPGNADFARKLEALQKTAQ